MPLDGAQAEMVYCKECPSRPITSEPIAHNCYRCQLCGKPVFAIHDPFAPGVVYSALGNASLMPLNVPDNVLLDRIADQSPIDEVPRNMIIEFNRGTACVIVQRDTRPVPSRRSLEKAAGALQRNVISVHLPVELMARIRDAAHSPQQG